MASLLKGQGYFSLSDSDSCIGSYLSVDDICEILEIDDKHKACFLSAIENLNLVKDGYIDEKDLYPKWKDIKKMFSSNPPLPRTSFDEYVLLAIFRRTFPDGNIEQQVKVGEKYIDFKITYNGETKYIEFDGPSHFIANSNKKQEDPLKRIDEVQKETKCELVRWPFWIQRCSNNAQIIFDRDLKGNGALWSSTKYFGNFTIPNPSNTIKLLTQRFNAENSKGIGYFYEEGKEFKKPAHPIIKEIFKNPSKIALLIPKDADKPKYWIPEELLWVLDKS